MTSVILVVLALAGGCQRAADDPPPAKKEPPAALSTTAGNVPAVFDAPGGTAKSSSGRYAVLLEPLAAPIPLRRIHKWRVTVRDASGEFVDGARLSLDGGMPAHDHGFPTTPVIDGPIRPGVFLVDGIKFNMPGWWRFHFEIRVGAVTDTVTFDYQIEE